MHKIKRLLSGIQPTGHLHLGNYLGALKNWDALLHDDYEAFFFMADLHSITLPQDPKSLHHNTLATAAMYIACGLDPSKCSIFLQSQMPEHTEMSWIFSCTTQLGWLNRMTQFKEKSQKFQADASSLGLYAYPVLMAADILLYQPDYVPVGEDQKQHIELARDIAGSFNRYVKKDFFKLPEPLIVKEGARVMSLRDGTKKMSKSDESDNSRINLTDSAELIVSKIKKAKTDSLQEIYFDKEKRPDISNLINIYASLSGESIKQLEQKYKNSTTAQFKEDLAGVIVAALEPINLKFMQLMKDRQYLLQILNDGREKAKNVASSTLFEAKKLFGFVV